MLEYPTMTLDEIGSLPVGKLADSDAHLYVWTTQKYIWDTPKIMEAWGFRTSMILTWCKPPFGFSLGDSYGLATEFCIFGRRGKLRPKNRTNRDWWNWSRGRHSAKPEEFQTVVESVSPGPYLELFARRKRHGWISWGNEITNDIEMPNGMADNEPGNCSIFGLSDGGTV
jgi:N6-adenosine-specific RNA methylase IME4